MLEMVLYEIHKVINPRNIPQLRIDAYNECMNTLEKISKGSITADLPIYEKQDELGQRVDWGTSSSNNYNW